jgi:hypothetical protein
MYTTAQTVLGAFPGLLQPFRIKGPFKATYPARRNVVALLDGLTGGVSAIMLIAGALGTYPPVISTDPQLRQGKAGDTYRTTLTASGGDWECTYPIKNWAVRAGGGALPPGLTLSDGTGDEIGLGVIAGRPQEPGTYHFEIICTDDYGPPQYSPPKLFTLVVD